MSATRRRFLVSSTALAAAGGTAGTVRSAAAGGFTMRIKDVRPVFREHRYRTPYKFGGAAVDRSTLLEVEVDIETADGRRVTGYGAMPMGSVWAFPARDLPREATLGAMRAVAERIADILRACPAAAHPLEFWHLLEPEYLQAAAEESRRLALAEPIPKLAVLVAASPFDAALHDACGRALGVSSFRTLSPDVVGHDASRYLGDEFRGVDLQATLRPEPAATVPLFHSVGGVDPLTEAEADAAGVPRDGLPRTLAAWIRRDGLWNIKIKLQGESLDWDVDRTLAVDRIAREVRPDAGWRFCVDFNERCPHVDYVLDYLRRVGAGSRQCLESILYVEQPTARDLTALPRNDMHAAAKLRPIVIDESLTDLESLRMARDLGYTGVALKACKGQSHTVLMTAAAARHGMFVCVQDLTCPGAALVHSAGIAAWVPGIAGIEANARQYVPEANREWEDRLPGLFRITDGCLHTACLAGLPGLGTGVRTPVRSAD
jgi:L-alanine-DL-glutamate epimerase-like enolase superfamily enzyme